MRQIRGLLFVGLVAAALAGCGGSDDDVASPLNAQALAACEGSPLAGVPNLPESFPMVDGATLTQQHEEGPTQVVEGYFDGEIQEAHDVYKSGFESAGYIVLFDEVEKNDSEVSWKGKGRSGQVALRDKCGDDDRIYVHITNRPT